MAIGADGLTDMQRRFVEEYAKIPNATQAYENAGYKARGHAAGVAASRLLTNVDVRNAIDAALRAKSERTKMDADWIVRRLRKNYFRADKAEQFSAANRALELCGKSIGMFKDQMELTGKDGKPVQADVKTQHAIADDLKPYGDAVRVFITAVLGSGDSAIPPDRAGQPVHQAAPAAPEASNLPPP